MVLCSQSLGSSFERTTQYIWCIFNLAVKCRWSRCTGQGISFTVLLRRSISLFLKRLEDGTSFTECFVLQVIRKHLKSCKHQGNLLSSHNPRTGFSEGRNYQTSFFFFLLLFTCSVLILWLHVFLITTSRRQKSKPKPF